MKLSNHKIFWRFTSLLLIWLIPFSAVSGIAKKVWAVSEMSQLKVEGRIIRDGSGRPIVLKGFNIEMHNWAYEDAHYSEETKIWKMNNESELIILQKQMNKWILASEDLQRIKRWGANVIRLQVSHYFFESVNSPGKYYLWAFAKLNEWINLAAKYGLYVIIDLHVPYGGRQYNCNDSACMEGKTLWINSSQKDYVKNLWRAIVLRTKHHPNVLYELMNEPYPQNANTPDSEWWNLAQELVGIIRAEDAGHIIIISNPLPGEPFKIIADSLNNIAYDFHFYLPYEYTHQQAFWMNKPYPPANYPYPDKWEWLANTYDRDESDFEGSQTWIEWRETFSTKEELYCNNPSEQDCTPPTHVRPTLSSYDNIGMLSFDNARLLIDEIAYPLSNAGFENGTGSFPKTWTQWGKESTQPAFWNLEAGNRYVTIPSTSGKKSRSVMPEIPYCIQIPKNYRSMTVIADAKGLNKNEHGHPANIFGLDWLRKYTYDQIQMEKDINQFIQFSNSENVPLMCLEFGVIMAATKAQGHLTWLRDFTALLEKHQIHGTYHSYRGFCNDKINKSFGIYQCWGKSASECPLERKFEYVLSGLRPWIGKPSWQPGILLLIE